MATVGSLMECRISVAPTEYDATPATARNQVLEQARIFQTCSERQRVSLCSYLWNSHASRALVPSC